MTTLRHCNQKGSILVAALILVAMLAAMSMTFASRIETNELRLENDIAGEQALHVAQAATNDKLQDMWRQYGTRRTDQRVAWIAGEDQNGNRQFDPASSEDANYNGQFDGPPGRTSPPYVCSAATTVVGANAFQYDAQGRLLIPLYTDDVYVPYAQGEAKTTVTVANINKKEYADIRIETIARVNSPSGRQVYRKIERVIRYGLGPAKVFDYVYFANNYGWMYGSGLNLYGSMGANGNLGFSGTPKVDGKLFAALNNGLGAAGVVNGNPAFDSLAAYRGLAAGNSLMRPTNPAAPPEDLNNNGMLDAGEDANSNGKLDMYEYDVGYDGTQPRTTAADQITMPYLGDLQMYKDLATSYARPARPDLGEPNPATGSVVKQLKAPGLDPTNPNNYNIIIDQTYGYNGTQNGKYSTVDGTGKVVLNDITKKLDTTTQEKNGNVALIGTPAQPIVIMGPVVISNDLVIKGVVKGQGTFYVGRNTHVVGDVTYSDPPVWHQNDTAFDATTASNKTKDGVGFGTKGSVILGNYARASLSGGDGGDSWNTATGYMKPTFTQPYAVDSTDASNGYVTSTVNGQPTFHGDYTQTDGGKKYADFNNTPTSATRRFYESSFPTSYINSIATKPTQLHGIFYTNHYFGGRTNQVKMYGNMVTRDEGIVTDSSADWYYDPRISKGELSSYIELFLPRDSTFSVLLYRELPATDD